MIGLGAWAADNPGDVAAWIAGLTGLAAFFSAARTSRLQQMHSLFTEYLKLEFDYNIRKLEHPASQRLLRANLASFKMYTFEEMALWLKRERAWSTFYLWSRFHRDHIDSWQATVRWHIDRCSKQDIEQFETAIDCYGPDMIDIVADSVARVPRDDPHRRGNDETANCPIGTLEMRRSGREWRWLDAYAARVRRAGSGAACT